MLKMSHLGSELLHKMGHDTTKYTFEHVTQGCPDRTAQFQADRYFHRAPWANQKSQTFAVVREGYYRGVPKLVLCRTRISVYTFSHIVALSVLSRNDQVVMTIFTTGFITRSLTHASSSSPRNAYEASLFFCLFVCGWAERSSRLLSLIHLLDSFGSK